jgi:hypothetical protein
MRVNTTVELERWNAAGTVCTDETVELVGEVDLESDDDSVETTVTISEPDTSLFSDRDVREMRFALSAEAFAVARREREKQAFATDFVNLAFAVSGS